MTRRYWESVGGTLVEEFPVVRTGPGVGGRWLDGLILLDGQHRIASADEVDVADQDVIVIQTKASRLGMYLMGQAFFSRELIADHRPRSVRTVALCTATDARLQPLCDQYGIEVVVDPLPRSTPAPERVVPNT
jgi:hypothetical protein